MATYTSSYIAADGLNIFYRSAKPAERPDAPILLLLHGFPSSSHQYRNLIPLLSQKYHVVAPDLPGFGFTEVPPARNYSFTFASLTTSTLAFLDALKIEKFAVYIFDYGAPVGLRIALQRPDDVLAVVSQNGNAYVEGLGDFWAPLKKYWASGSAEDRKFLLDNALTFEATKGQYTHGTPSTHPVAPESYTLDYALMCRPGNKEIQLDLFYDYRTNVEIYPQFQEWLRKSQVPLLAVWGKNDVAFIPAGAEAFKNDVPGAEVRLLDAGHFAGETHTREIAELMLEFLGRKGDRHDREQ